MIYDKRLDIFRVNGGFASRVLFLQKSAEVRKLVKQDLRITDEQFDRIQTEAVRIQKEKK